MSSEVAVEWIVEESDPPFRWGYDAGRIVAEWPGVLSLRAKPDGDLEAISVDPGAPRDLVDKVRLGIASAFLRACRGLTSLHASAVALHGAAIVCAGDSGSGKSTLALHMCQRPGVELLSDDITALDVGTDSAARVLPSERCLWVAPGPTPLRGGQKHPVMPDRVAVLPADLRCLVCLSFCDDADDAIRVRVVRGRQALEAMIPSLVRFERGARVWAREFEFASTLVSRHPVVVVQRSRSVRPEAAAGAVIELFARSFS
jgi:hypothetical protein